MRSWLWLLVLALFVPLALHAAEARVNVTGLAYKDYGRLVFNTPAKGTFEIRVNGDQLHILLSDPIEANFRDAFGPLREYIASASVKGGREVIIKLKQPNMRVRKFQSAGMFGVDLLKQATKAETAVAEPKKKPEAPAAKKKEEKAEPQKLLVLNAPKPRPRPEAPAEEKKIEKAKTEEPKSKLKTSDLAPEKKEAVKEEKPATVQPAMPPANEFVRFPFAQNVSAAIFLRGNTLWAIFDKPSRMNVQALVKDGIAEAHQLPDRHGTILQLKVKPEVDVKSLWIARDDFAWVINKGKPPVVTPIAVETTLGEGASVKMKVLQAADPLTFTDPEVGDELFIVPVRDPSNFVSPGRRFIDMHLLPTLQGVAIRRMSEPVRFKVDREGVNITSMQNLVASEVVLRPQVEETASAEEKAAAVSLTNDSMFPFAENPDPAEFMPGYYSGIKALSEAPEAELNNQRLKLAEFFFTQGYYSESLGLLREILDTDPEFSDGEHVRDTIAAALYLMGRYDQAGEAFNALVSSAHSPEFKDEQKLWLWASNQKDAEENLSVPKPLEGFDPAWALQKYMASYPVALRRDFMLLLASQMIEQSRTGLAREFLEKLAKLSPNKAEADYAGYLHARALEIERKDDMAIAAYNKLLEHADNGRARVSASLALAKFLKMTNKAPLPDLIKMLEAERLGWRGNRLEIDLLRTLGNFYIENKNYIEGLRTWRTLVSNYSGTQTSLEVAGDMAKVYASLFDSTEAYQMSPVQALGIFFEFNELMPVGVQGDRISRKLAEHLESVDLLESAAAILTHQVRYRSQGADRAQLAAKLTELHLANNRVDLATEVLTAMEKEQIPDNLKAQFRALKSELLIRQEKYDEALALIKDDAIPEATELKLAIYWNQQQWEHVIAILEPKIKARAANQDSLTPDEEQRVLRLAIAYSKLRRWSDIDWIKDAYGKRIKTEEVGDAFDFVTSRMSPVDHSQLENSLELNKLQSFLKKYRKPEPAPAPEPVAAPEKKTEGEEPAKDDKEAPAPEKKAKEEKPDEKKDEEAKKEEPKKEEEKK